jgi:hypothetical protein
MVVQITSEMKEERFLETEKEMGEKGRPSMGSVSMVASADTKRENNGARCGQRLHER